MHGWFVFSLAAAYTFSLSVVTLHFLYSICVIACVDVALVLSRIQSCESARAGFEHGHEMNSHETLLSVSDGTDSHDLSNRQSVQQALEVLALQRFLPKRLDMFLSSIARSHGGQPRQSRQHKPWPT